MKYVVITLAPLVLFAAVVVLGVLWTSEPLRPAWEPAQRAAIGEPSPPAPRLAREPAPAPAATGGPTTAREDAARVPPHLKAPLQAVAADVSLCVSQRLARDLGPIDVDIVFTPVPGGAFAQGTRVFTNWQDPVVEDCIAEVFDEATFLPDDGARFERSEFVFHFPEDAQAGLLGLSYSPFH